MTATDAVLLTKVRAAARNGRAVEVRQAAGLSQAELAAAIGVSPASLSRWEAGLRRPRGTAALRYAEVLEMLEKVAA